MSKLRLLLFPFKRQVRVCARYVCVCAGYVCVCVTAFCHCRLRSTNKIVGDFYHFKWRPQQGKKWQKKKEGAPVKWGALSGSFPYFSARCFFRRRFSRFSLPFLCLAGLTAFCFVAFALFVAILGEDLHYNLLCGNTMHPSVAHLRAYAHGPSPPSLPFPFPFPCHSTFHFPMANFPMRRDVGDKKTLL